VAGVDFNKSFAHMAKFITIRCITTLIAALEWKIHHIKVKTMFFIDIYIYIYIWIN
jgi:hypothetical protein